jgi:hypothetical protein
MMNSPALQPGFKTFGNRHYDALGILRYFRKSLFAWECVVGWEDSNFQPNDYQPPALSIEQSGAVS